MFRKDFFNDFQLPSIFTRLVGILALAEVINV